MFRRIINRKNHVENAQDKSDKNNERDTSLMMLFETKRERESAKKDDCLQWNGRLHHRVNHKFGWMVREKACSVDMNVCTGKTRGKTIKTLMILKWMFVCVHIYDRIKREKNKLFCLFFAFQICCRMFKCLIFTLTLEKSCKRLNQFQIQFLIKSYFCILE